MTTIQRLLHKIRVRSVKPTWAVAPTTVPSYWEPAPQRLTRLASWCLTGRLADAELELNTWQREPNCPAQAIVLLATLLARRGCIDHALRVLPARGKLDPHDDPNLGQTLVCVLMMAEYEDAARRVARELDRDHGYQPALAAWLDAASLHTAPRHNNNNNNNNNKTQQVRALQQSVVDQLAVELIAHPMIIPSLVVAQSHKAPAPHDPTLALLRAAIRRASDDLNQRDEQLAISQAMSTLALLAHDQNDARQWAHRGLRIDPYSAQLALVLANIEDDERIGPAAADVLARVADAHPSYPDVRAALIRRQNAQGHNDAARLRLAQWLADEPEHPIAQAVQREIAA